MGAHEVRRLDARTASVEEVRALDDGETVVVLSHALAGLDSEAWLGATLDLAGDKAVFYKRVAGEARQTLQSTCRQVWSELIPTSCHTNGILLMDENVLFEAPESAARILPHLPEYVKADYFPLFPEALRPSPLCLLMGGLGARSELHADPFSWTGWNCLLQGSKAWRFYPNAPQNSETAFRGERRPFGVAHTSTGGESPAQLCTIAAGWRSDVDLFSQPRQSLAGSGPPFGPDLSRHPHAQQATPSIEYQQCPGELVIFPGHWWHQTYHCERTLGVAGQMLNDQNLRRVMDHIIHWCDMGDMRETLWSMPPRSLILAVLGEAIDSM